MIRIPYSWIEVRTGDSGMNPYLALAAIIVAGLDGIDRNLDPGPAHNPNFYGLSPAQVRDLGVRVLPRNLEEAIAELAASELLRNALGPRLVDEFIDLKRAEWTDYHRHVSEWETRRYLSFF